MEHRSFLNKDPVLLEWNCAALSLPSLLTSSDHAPLVSCFHNCVWSELHSIWGSFVAIESFCVESILTVDQQPHLRIRIQYCHLILSIERETAWLEPPESSDQEPRPPSHPFTLTQLCSTFQTSFASTSFAGFIHFIYPLPWNKTTLQQFKQVHQRLIMNMAQWSSQFHKLNCLVTLKLLHIEWFLTAIFILVRATQQKLDMAEESGERSHPMICPFVTINPPCLSVPHSCFWSIHECFGFQVSWGA